MAQLTSRDLGVDLNSRVSWNQLRRKFDPLVDGNPGRSLVRPPSAWPSSLRGLTLGQQWHRASCCRPVRIRNRGVPTVPAERHLLAHAQHSVDFLDAQPMKNVWHQSLESHILDACNVLGSLEVIRSSIFPTLAGVVNHCFSISSPAENPDVPTLDRTRLCTHNTVRR